MRVQEVGRWWLAAAAAAVALQAATAGAVGLPRPGEFVPRQIPYRGTLDRSGVPVTSTALQVIFELFTTETGGTAAWTETQTIAVADGQFTVALGDVVTIPPTLFNQPSLYLQISVDGQQLAGRQRLLTAPYSHSASTVRGQDITTWLVPSGTIVPFAGATAPAGWLPCDGRSVARADYSTLFAAIGTAWGAPSSTTFRLPDLRGRFLRGVDGGSGRDPDASSRTASGTGGNTGGAVGTVQADATGVNGLSVVAVGDHQHGDASLRAVTISGYETSRYTDSTAGEIDILHGYEMPPAGAHTHTLAGDRETRPVNAAVNWIIKL